LGVSQRLYVSPTPALTRDGSNRWPALPQRFVFHAIGSSSLV
jgi:hypothetical protein